MRCNILGWLLGLPAIALIWGLAVKGERTQIIADLEQRTRAVLQSEELTWAKARFDATDGKITGAAYSEEERGRALRVAKQIWGVWSIKDATKLVERAPNYVWEAAIQDDNIQLSGYVPNEKARRQILKVAKERFPQHSVRDDMRPARGAPGEDVWIDGISFGLRQLTQLKQGGRVNLRGTRLGVSGEAESVTAYRTIKGDISRRLPSGIMLAKDEVKPPHVSPFKWNAAYKANQVEISGHVPPGKARDKLVEIATEAFPKAAIVYKLTAASGAPQDWIKAVSIVLRSMAKLQTAQSSITNQNVMLKGLAVKEVTSERVAASLQVGMPDKYKLDYKIDFQQPTLPTVSPFTTTITSDGERVSLTGFAPDERGRRRLVTATKQRFPKREIVDALTYANGAPAGWLTCADAGVLGLSRLDKGRAELSGPLLRLTGETRNEKAATGLPAEVRAAANRACKDTIEIKVQTPPEPRLKWQALSIENRLELSGEVIHSGIKTIILKDAARLFPKFAVVDNMRINPGRSEKWTKVLRLGLEQLAKMRSGLVQLDNQVLTLNGIAPDTAVSTQVKSRIERGIASGYTGQAVIEVKSDAMIWSEQEAKRKSKAAAEEAERKKAEGAKRAAALQEVQQRAARAAAKARAAAEERGRQKELERRRAAEEAQRKADAEARRLAELAAIEEEARRKAAEAEVAARRQAEAKAMAARCKKELNETAEQGIIQFEVGSNRLSEASTTTLDQLIRTYENCPGAQLEIGGHTDSTGGESNNLKLSQSRAEAVLEYFVARGLPRDKFIARGYGEFKPRATNDTPSNRARNRRIEFDVMAN